MYKVPFIVCLKKFIQIEGVIDVSFIRQDAAFFEFVANHGRQLISEHRHARHPLVGIGFARQFILFFGRLFIGIRPVEHLIRAELLVGNGLERRTRQILGVLSSDIVQGPVGFSRFDTFMRFIDDEQIPADAMNPIEFIVFATMMNRTFQTLERFEFDHAEI